MKFHNFKLDFILTTKQKDYFHHFRKIFIMINQNQSENFFFGCKFKEHFWTQRTKNSDMDISYALFTYQPSNLETGNPSLV